jgi:hypothetical protein
MENNNQGGYVSGLLVGLIVSVVLLVGALGFGTWAFLSRQDYKNNSDQKVVAAVEEAIKATEEADAIKYAEEAKNPLKTHKGPDAFGSVTLQYPKTWSGYLIETLSNSTAVDNYFHPDVVRDARNQENSHALRIQVVNQTYDKAVDSYKDAVERGNLKASAYSLPKVAGVVGTRFDGEVEVNKQGSMVVLPVRNMTLKVWTESTDYLADFNNIILPNLSFAP